MNMQNSPKAKKAAKTRAKNTRLRAIKAKARSAAALSEQATHSKRAKAYSDMENSVCDLSRAAELAMTMFDNDRLFLFTVEQLDFMVQRFKEHYYAEEFPI
jgi:hypothetical protein